MGKLGMFLAGCKRVSWSRIIRLRTELVVGLALGLLYAHL